jgi:hypothetical protein
MVRSRSMPVENITQDELLGTIKMLAVALDASVRGQPVDAARCFAAAKRITADTEFAFERNSRR